MGQANGRWFRDVYRDALWEAVGMKAADKAVAEVYARHARDASGDKSATADLAWVTYPRLMEMAGLGRRENVSKSVDRLVESGWLTVVLEVPRRPTTYRLTIPAGARSSDGGTSGAEAASSDAGTTGQNVSESASSDGGTSVVPVGDHGSSVFAAGSSDGGTRPLGPLKDHHKEPPSPYPLTAAGGSVVGEAVEGEEEISDQEEREARATDIRQLLDPYIDKIRPTQAQQLTDLIADAFDRGWFSTEIAAELDGNHDGARDLGAVLIRRVQNLKDPPLRIERKRIPTIGEHNEAIRRLPPCDHGVAGGNVPKEGDRWMACSMCRRLDEIAQAEAEYEASTSGGVGAWWNN